MMFSNPRPRALAALALAAALGGCHWTVAAPGAALIEGTAMRARQQGDAQAERQLDDWARARSPVAERELGLLYLARPTLLAEAMRLFAHAARAGDAEAAFQLGQLYRLGVAGAAPAPDKASAWYQLAARQHHAGAALVLGMLFKNGDGVPRDAQRAAAWLERASALGNAHAMFLLSNAYRDGAGVPRDPARGRALLEQAAEHDYPPALQELALTVQTGDALSPRDEQRAAHLLKEATEHRHNNWNRF